MARRVLIHCNAGVDIGMGHAMRAVGVAEAAIADNWDVTIGGDLSADAASLLTRMVPAATVVVAGDGEGGTWLADAVERIEPNVVHVDSYRPATDTRDARHRHLLSNMQDGPFGVRPADLGIDGNHGAERWFVGADRYAACIVGASGAVIREQVRARRDRTVESHPRARILVVIGGTDPARLTTRCLRAVLTMTMPIEVTVICRPDQLDEAKRLAAGSDHPVVVHGFVEDLPRLAAAQDLIVSAAGTSVWDFACMGIPTALICAADNQRAGYRSMVESGLCIGLGEAPHTDLEERAGAIGVLLTDAAALARLRERLMALVDGLGAWRIVASWSQLLDVPPTGVQDTALRARRATAADAQLLFDWRNDPATREASRSSDALDWEEHVQWLRTALSDANRQLLIIEDAVSRPVGTVRWDRLDGGWEVSITTAPGERGRGQGAHVLAAGELALVDPSAARLIAAIHRDNVPSRRLFARAGYLPHQPADADGYAVFAKWRSVT